MPLSSKTRRRAGGVIRAMTSSAHLPTSAAALAFGQSRTARVAAWTLRGADRLAPDLAARLAVRLFFTPFPLKLAARRRLPPEWRVQRHPDGPHGFALLRHRPSSLVAGRPRVLLVHGWTGDALQMRGLGEAVAAAGFEPVLMDLPAHGRSPGWRCTMPQIVASLRAAEACVGPFAGIVAHSMGALATLHAMASGLATPRVVALAPSPRCCWCTIAGTGCHPSPTPRHWRLRCLAPACT